MSKSLAERFTEKVDVNGPVPAHAPEMGPCALWTASRRSDGYGQIMLQAEESPRGKDGPVLAQRVAFFLHFGRWAVPFAIQSCRNRLCVRWGHLVEGPRGSNRAPITERPCRKCGAKDRNAKGNCRLCHLERELARYHSDPVMSRAIRRAHTYGISVDAQFALFKAQDERCANHGCRTPITFREAHVDHDHSCCPNTPACGRCVRGFLCGDCNAALGRTHDSIPIILGLADYLTHWMRTRATA